MRFRSTLFRSPGPGGWTFAPIPDQQTQIAQLAVGGIDYLKVAEKDQAAFLSADPRLAVTATQGQTFNYMAIDASGRSGNKPLSDIRVRQALFRSIDRDLITKSLVAGGSEAKVLDELCFKSQFGCGFSAKPQPFDRMELSAVITGTPCCLFIILFSEIC